MLKSVSEEQCLLYVSENEGRTRRLPYEKRTIEALKDAGFIMVVEGSWFLTAKGVAEVRRIEARDNETH